MALDNLMLDVNNIQNVKVSRSLKLNMPEYVNNDTTSDGIFINSDVIKSNYTQKSYDTFNELIEVKTYKQQGMIENHTKILNLDFDSKNNNFIYQEDVQNENKEVQGFFLYNGVNLFADLNSSFINDIGDIIIFDSKLPPTNKINQDNIVYVQDTTTHDSTIIDIESINDAVFISYVKTDDSLIIIQTTRDLNYFEKLVVTKYMWCDFNVRNLDDFGTPIKIRKKILFEDICNGNI